MTSGTPGQGAPARRELDFSVRSACGGGPKAQLVRAPSPLGSLHLSSMQETVLLDSVQSDVTPRGSRAALALQAQRLELPAPPAARGVPDVYPALCAWADAGLRSLGG